MVKYTQAIRRQIADELFECLTIFRGLRLKGQCYTDKELSLLIEKANQMTDFYINETFN